MFMYFLRLLLEAFLLFSKRIAFLLSWYTIFSKTSYPWASNHYLVHITAGIQSSTAKISVSVDIFVFRFCFVELAMVSTLIIDRPPPVRTLIFGWTVNDPSIHHFSMPLPLALSIICRFLVPLLYFIRWTNLSQLSLAGSFTLVVKNLIAVQVSILDRLVANNIFATRRWNYTARFVLSFLQSSYTLKIIAGAALGLVPPPVGSDLSKASIISSI